MFILGCGYIGTQLARQAVAHGERVIGVVRSQTRIESIQKIGVEALQCDLDRADLPPDCTRDQAVYYCAPPPPKGDGDTRMQRFLAGLDVTGQPRRIVYLSTTGVYGDCRGAWVDESWPANPQVDRSRRRWDAEQALHAWRERSGGELVILRVAGIYGPGKLPLERLRQGLPMVAEADAPWTNRIHADDLVAACIAAMRSGVDGEVYNACDGTPGNMTDYFNQVADLFNIARPSTVSLQQAQTELSAGMLSYLAESRRLSNRKLLEHTGLVLRYPDLASGLAASISDD